MIIGIGSDICDITRIEKSLARFGQAFENRVFSEGERAKAPAPTPNVLRRKKRWARRWVPVWAAAAAFTGAISRW
jgi:holo-[acyl-carrier protein] synthase